MAVICDEKVATVRKKVRASKPLAKSPSESRVQSIAKTVLAAIRSLPLDPTVKAQVDGYARDISEYIEAAQKEKNLGSRTTKLLETLAIRVAQYRLTSVVGLAEAANEHAQEVTALADTLEVELHVPHKVTEKIITSGRDQIYDPYKRPL